MYTLFSYLIALSRTFTMPIHFAFEKYSEKTSVGFIRFSVVFSKHMDRHIVKNYVLNNVKNKVNVLNYVLNYVKNYVLNYILKQILLETESLAFTVTSGSKMEYAISI